VEVVINHQKSGRWVIHKNLLSACFGLILRREEILKRSKCEEDKKKFANLLCSGGILVDAVSKLGGSKHSTTNFLDILFNSTP